MEIFPLVKHAGPGPLCITTNHSNSQIFFSKVDIIIHSNKQNDQVSNNCMLGNQKIITKTHNLYLRQYVMLFIISVGCLIIAYLQYLLI